MVLNGLGRIVEQCLRDVPEHFSSVILDEYVVMPDHVHFILVMNSESTLVCRGEACLARKLKPKSLGAVVGAFKSAVSKQVNELCGVAGVSVWQRNFHDRIVRNDEELSRIREYILSNPACRDIENNNLSR